MQASAAEDAHDPPPPRPFPISNGPPPQVYSTEDLRNHRISGHAAVVRALRPWHIAGSCCGRATGSHPGATVLTTLYVSHPASFDHEVPEGHPERPARMRAVERALEDERFAGLVRASAPRAALEAAALAHPRILRRRRRRSRARRPAWCQSTPTPSCRPAPWRRPSGRRRRHPRRRCRHGGRVPQRLRGHASARPPRRAHARDGLLPVQPRRHRGPPRPGEARRRARRPGRLGRPPRQRHPGHLLGRRRGAVLLDAPDAAVSGHRRRLRARRQGHDRQRAAPAERRRRGVPRSVRGRHPAAPGAPSGPTSSSSRRASTPTASTRWRTCAWRRRISAGRRGGSWMWPIGARTGGSSRSSRAATASKAWRSPPPRTWTR